MTKDGGGMKHSHATNENLDLLYTLDRHDINEETNDTDRKRMKKYMEGVMNEFLTERQREIVKMYLGEKIKTSQIAEKLGISHNTVKNILKSSIKKINQHKKIFI